MRKQSKNYSYSCQKKNLLNENFIDISMSINFNINLKCYHNNFRYNR